MLNKRADLHIHTSFSDGFYSPAEILQKSLALGYGAISVTDHDTVEGLISVMDLASGSGMEVLPGTELSTTLDGEEIHILGYMFDPHESSIRKYLSLFEKERINRAKKIIEKLNNEGIPLKYEHVVEMTGEGVIGRPHIAKALVRQGLVQNFYKAFKDLLSKDQPAYVEKYTLSTTEAVKIINDAGGLAFLAHPGLTKPIVVDKILKGGIDGIEVFHPSHTYTKTRSFKKLAKKYGLLVSGGSDFHGGGRNDEVHFGKYNIGMEEVDNIKKIASYKLL